MCVREKKCACMGLASGSVWYPASHFTAYVDLLCSVNRLVRGSIVPPANTAAELLTPVLLKSQIPSAIIPAHPAPLTAFSPLYAILNIPDEHVFKHVV